MTAALERIKEHLDRLEAAPISTEHTPFENVRPQLQVMITAYAARITLFNCLTLVTYSITCKLAQIMR